ncbi:23226_t:CDS:2, partial [Rhizophagus irregularis]
ELLINGRFFKSLRFADSVMPQVTMAALLSQWSVFFGELVVVRELLINGRFFKSLRSADSVMVI